MLINQRMLAVFCVVLIAIGGCSRQQSDWQKTREANTTDAYEQFLKKYPSGEFAAQAQAHLKEMYEERDWQKARDADTPEAYQAFLKQYPEGKWTEEARIRVENFTLAQAPGAAASSAGPGGAEPGAAGSSGGAAPAGGASQSAPPSMGSAPAGSSTPTVEDETGPSSHPPAAAKHPGAAAASHSKSEQHGKYAVQLGAFKSGREAAHKRWEHLEKQYPTLFTGLSSKVLAKKGGGGTLYRLQAVGMSEARAHKICKTLKSKSQPCVVVPPRHVT